MKHFLFTAMFAMTSCTLIAGYETSQEEGAQCADSLDNDGDGNPDCADEGCATSDACADAAPVAVDDSLSAEEDTPRTIAFAELLENDTDEEGDPLTIISVQNPQNGTVSLGETSIVFTPDDNFFGAASFEYTVSDGTSTDTALVNLAVSGFNKAPTAVDDNLTALEDTVAVFQLSEIVSNDIDPDGDTLFAVSFQGGEGGEFFVDQGAGTLTFTPDANFSGTALVGYTVSDGSLEDTATIFVEVASLNSPPSAEADELSTDEDTPLLIDSLTLLINDTDVDNATDELFIVSVDNAINGTAALLNNTITFTPDENFEGIASFEYTVQDPGGESSSTTVTITVAAVNDAPLAVADSVTAQEDLELPILFGALLANDLDIDAGETLTIISVQGFSDCVATISGDTIIVKGAPDFVGAAFFEYTMEDSGGVTSSAVVTVTITAENDAPVAFDDTLTMNEDTLLTLAVNDAALIGNDQDIDGDGLSVVSVQSALNGDVSLAGGVISFIPTLNVNGAASFEYTVTDGNGGFDIGRLDITIDAVNDAPSAGDDTFSTTEDSPLTIDVEADLLINDADIDGDEVVFVSAENAQGGSFFLDGDTITFTPDADFNGTASFEYTITDGAAFDIGLVVIAVGEAGDAPVANPDSDIIDEDTSSILSVDTLLLNDTDIDGDLLSVSSVQNAFNGEVTLVGGIVTFTPFPNFSGDAQYEYTITDGFFFASALVFITVNDLNEAPTATNDDNIVETNEDTPVDISTDAFLVNDFDVDGGTLSVSSVQNAVNGSVSLVGTTVTFTPAPNFSGVGSFAYTITDGQGGSATADASVTIIAVADAPSLAVNDASGDEDTTIALDISSSLVDLDGSETLSIELTGFPAGSVLSAGVVSGGGGGGFARGDFATGITPLDVAVGRFNSDAFDDLVAANQSENTLSVLLGNGDGTFGAQTLLNVGANPFRVVVGRFNADAFDDIAATNISSNSVSVLLGNGDGTFAAASDFATGPSPTGIVVGRFNADAFADLAVTDEGGTTIEVFLGNGDGTFGAPLVLGVGNNPFDLAVGRFNNDGIDDLVVTNINSNTATIFLGNGDGTFGAPDTIGTGPNPLGVAVGRLNGDAFDDLVIADEGSNTLTVLLGNGDGTFGPISTITVGNNPFYVKIGNFAGDNAKDIAVTNFSDSNVGILPGNGDGTFGPQTIFNTGANPRGMAVGRFDANATEDIVVANQSSNTVSVLLQQSGDLTVTLTQAELAGLTLTPPLDFNGVIEVTATAIATEGSNGSTASTQDTFTVTISPVNDAPVAQDDSFTAEQEIALNIADSLLLLNDFDVDGDLLSIASVQSAVNGIVTLAGNTITFTPNTGFVGQGSFEYTMTDGNGGVASAVVFVAVLPSVCGNGLLQGSEVCDDGNTISGDGCNAICADEFCGDGITNDAGAEGCDDGNGDELDGCTTLCVSAVVCTAAAFPSAPLNAGLFAVDPATGHCYIGATQATSWFNAENICEQNGGTLAVPDSAEENALILTIRPSAAEMWIGINDLNSEAGNNGGLFEKVTGGLISFVNFHIGQPDNSDNVGGEGDCVHYDFGNPDWNDFNCNNNVDIAHFACEFEPKVIFSEVLEQFDEDTTEQCNAWNDFRNDLNGSFTRITIRGSLDPIGFSCTGVNANILCGGLRDASDTGLIFCDGRNWGVDTGNCTTGRFPEPTVELIAGGNFCSCDQGPTVRPCIGNSNWGGIGNSCGATTQTLEVVCE